MHGLHEPRRHGMRWSWDCVTATFVARTSCLGLFGSSRAAVWPVVSSIACLRSRGVAQARQLCSSHTLSQTAIEVALAPFLHFQQRCLRCFGYEAPNAAT